MDKINGVGIFRNKILYMFMANSDIKKAAEMSMTLNSQDKTAKYECESMTINVIKE